MLRRTAQDSAGGAHHVAGEVEFVRLEQRGERRVIGAEGAVAECPRLAIDLAARGPPGREVGQ